MLAQETHPNRERLRSRSKPKQWVIATSLTLLLFLTGACNGGSDNESAVSATPEQATTEPGEETAVTQPSATQATPTPSPTSTPVPTPTPTPDPLVVEAEEVAVAYFLTIHRIVDDVRLADPSEAIRLEAEGGPLEDYAFKLINESLKANDYLEFDELRWEVIGSEIINPSAGAVDVSICVKGAVGWRDFDTDEITLTTSTSEPFVSTYQIRRDGDGSGLKVWTFVDTDADDEAIPCELSEVS